MRLLPRISSIWEVLQEMLVYLECEYVIDCVDAKTCWFPVYLKVSNPQKTSEVVRVPCNFDKMTQACP